MSRVEWWELKVSFTTPVFLGGPDGNAQWRTPPFKALFRRWWRVVYAKGSAPVPADLFRAESALFGRAADTGTTASRVRFRLDWRPEAAPQTTWQEYSFQRLRHPEVNRPVSADLYLGYGPIGRRGAQRSFLPPGARQTLRVGWPLGEAEQFAEIVRLVQVFGVLGGRSRNGWGSLNIGGGPTEYLDMDCFLDPADSTARDWVRHYSRAWDQAVQADTDWCHAVGADETGLLLWRTPERSSWQEVLADWGAAKIEFRTQFRFPGSTTASGLHRRHLLAYPITRHAYRGALRDHPWHRCANQLVFKVLTLPGDRYVGLAAHLPHALPRRLREGIPSEERDRVRRMELEVWPAVHSKLDEMLTRLP